MSYIPNPEELVKALDEVHYEFFQLASAAGFKVEQVPINNALLESFLLHLRNLHVFFGSLEGRQADVLAEHYNVIPHRPLASSSLIISLSPEEYLHKTGRTSGLNSKKGLL